MLSHWLYAKCNFGVERGLAQKGTLKQLRSSTVTAAELEML